MSTKRPFTITLICGLLFTSFTSKASDNTSSGVKVYPTPSHERVVIQTQENGTLKIVDQNGILVMETPIYKGTNELKVSGMTAQKYIMQIKAGDNNVVKRLFIR